MDKNGRPRAAHPPQTPTSLPRSIHADWINSEVASIQSLRRSGRSGPPRSRHHISFMFLRLTGQLFIEPEQIYNWRRAAVLGGKQVKPWNICPFRGISSLVCSEFSPGVSAAGRHRPGMPVIRREEQWRSAPTITPIPQRSAHGHKVTWLPEWLEGIRANQMPEVPVKEFELLVFFIIIIYFLFFILVKAETSKCLTFGGQYVNFNDVFLNFFYL